MLKKSFQDYDYTLVIPVFLLCGFGLVMIYSSSMVVAMNLDPPLPADYFFKNQLINFAAALIAFIVAMLTPYKIYRKLMKIIIGVSLLLLVLVLFLGSILNHAQSWISIAGFNLQPSEFAKLGLIIYLAAVFSKKQHYISNFSRAVLPPLVVILITFVLIFIEPDLGTAMIVAGAAGVLILCSGMRLKHLLGLFTLGGVLTGLLLMFGVFLSSEQMSRFSAAYQPFADPSGNGTQLIHSYIAIATGGITGQGLGQGIEKYGYLYASYTDFIVSIIAEELGLIGVLIVIALLGYIVFKGFLIGIRCEDTFGSLLAIGIAGLIGVQSIANLGVASGLLPTTGVPLPFISYGGSALVLFMFCAGLLVNISKSVKLGRTLENHI